MSLMDEYPMQRYLSDMTAELNQHIEEFAAAFIQHTKLSPDRIRMIVTHEFREGEIVQVIWFEEVK